MPEFFNVLPPDEARELLISHLTGPITQETVATEAALGRVTASSLIAPHALPSFRRSTMDGYAVRAADTYGASGSLPAFLTVIGEVKMGKPADFELAPGQAVVVHTGGMIPNSADGVVQIEHTQMVGAEVGESPPYDIEVFKAVAVGQNVLQAGEDVGKGDEILPAGHRLRPQDVGGLLALGITNLTVSKRPRVAILATGDEVVHPKEEIAPGQIRDINSYTVAGQTVQAGGIPVLCGIVPDQLRALQVAARDALAQNDMLVISAGSSVSVRDLTVRVVDELGEPGVLLHGVATRPGKPTIVGAVEAKPILGLPGNPVSAMIQFEMFGKPAISKLLGLRSSPRHGTVWAQIKQNIASESGREDFIPVRLRDTPDGPVAEPVFGKSNLIYTLVHADGLVKIPLNKGGLMAGEWLKVRLF